MAACKEDDRIITLVNSEMRVSSLNTDSYLKFSHDSKNDFGFAVLATVFEQTAL